MLEFCSSVCCGCYCSYYLWQCLSHSYRCYHSLDMSCCCYCYWATSVAISMACCYCFRFSCCSINSTAAPLRYVLMLPALLLLLLWATTVAVPRSAAAAAHSFDSRKEFTRVQDAYWKCQSKDAHPHNKPPNSGLRKGTIRGKRERRNTGVTSQ